MKEKLEKQVEFDFVKAIDRNFRRKCNREILKYQLISVGMMAVPVSMATYLVIDKYL